MLGACCGLPLSRPPHSQRPWDSPAVARTLPREPIPTTLPVLTTLRPQLTTTTIAPPPPQRRIYVVQPGDTLGKIALGFGVTVQALMEENGKEDTLLRIGEQLVIPPTVVGGGSSQ